MKSARRYRVELAFLDHGGSNVAPVCGEHPASTTVVAFTHALGAGRARTWYEAQLDASTTNRTFSALQLLGRQALTHWSSATEDRTPEHRIHQTNGPPERSDRVAIDYTDLVDVIALVPGPLTIWGNGPGLFDPVMICGSGTGTCSHGIGPYSVRQMNVANTTTPSANAAKRSGR